MTDNGHDLMDGTDHPAVPASPLRRDSMEDADSSLTRKRPRLDSGSGEQHGMSAAGNPSSAQGAPEPVEVTINIRSQPPSTQPEASRLSDMANDSSPAALPQDSPSPVVEASPNMALDQDDDPAAGSPPVLAIDDDEDDDAVGETDDYSEQAFIQFANDETPDDYYRRFPYADQQRTYTDTLRMLTTHVQTAQTVEGRLLPDVTEWLQRLPSRSISWPGFYLDYAYFWDEFSIFVTKVLSRR